MPRLLPLISLTILSVTNSVQAGEKPALVSNLLAQQVNPSNCQPALLESRNRLEQINGVQVVRTETRQHGYADYPAGRSQEYFIVLENNQAGENVMNSPVLLASISSAITSACNTIGFINFAISQTDWVRGYGLVGNRVTAFKCLDSDVRNGEHVYTDQQGNSYRKAPWGYQGCL